MKKFLQYLVILSVISFNTKYTFAQESKKEIGICGETISFVLNIDQNHQAKIGSIIQNKNEYCDDGRFEKGANVLVSLINHESTEVYNKEIFLNLHQYNEVIDPKTNKFIKTSIIKGQNSRILKLPKTKKMGTLKKIRITELNTKIVTEFDFK
jgi:hypothetical protein